MGAPPHLRPLPTATRPASPRSCPAGRGGPAAPGGLHGAPGGLRPPPAACHRRFLLHSPGGEEGPPPARPAPAKTRQAPRPAAAPRGSFLRPTPRPACKPPAWIDYRLDALRTESSEGEGKELWSCRDLSCNLGPVPPPCVTLGRSLHLSEPRFLHLRNDRIFTIDVTYFPRRDVVRMEGNTGHDRPG